MIWSDLNVYVPLFAFFAHCSSWNSPLQEVVSSGYAGPCRLNCTAITDVRRVCMAVSGRPVWQRCLTRAFCYASAAWRGVNRHHEIMIIHVHSCSAIPQKGSWNMLQHLKSYVFWDLLELLCFHSHPCLFKPIWPWYRLATAQRKRSVLSSRPCAPKTVVLATIPQFGQKFDPKWMEHSWLWQLAWRSCDNVASVSGTVAISWSIFRVTDLVTKGPRCLATSSFQNATCVRWKKVPTCGLFLLYLIISLYATC